HQRFSLSPADLTLVGLVRGQRLSRSQHEIVLLLAASALGVIESIDDVEDLQKHARQNGRDRLAIVRALAEDGTLVRAELIDVGDDDVPIERRVSLSWRSLAGILSRDGKGEPWRVQSPDELLRRCYPLCRELAQRSRSIGDE